jgi:hypothetical protein
MHALAIKLTIILMLSAIAGLTLSGIATIEQNVQAQNMTNASNLTGIENVSSNASVTARLDLPAAEPEPGDYPIPSPTDEWRMEKVSK